MWGGSLFAVEPSCDVNGVVHAKGMLVLRCRFPGEGIVNAVGLSLSVDGENFEVAGVGLPRPWNVFWSAYSSGEVTTVLVPGAASFEPGREKPGTYYLRCSAAFEEEGVGPTKIVHKLTVAPPDPSDLGFLRRVSNAELLGTLFPGPPNDIQEAAGGNAFSSSYSDLLAVAVIGELLKATRADEPGDVVGPRGGLENALKWADALFALAKEFPNSSYAAYAAYYAGCCYVGALGQENKDKHKEIVSPAGKGSAYYGKATEALGFAVERADAYLKPRALYHQAFLYLCSAEFDQAEDSLEDALEVGGEKGTIQKIVDKLRHDMRATKEKRAARERRGD